MIVPVRDYSSPTWLDVGQRCVTTAVPFLTLYKPISTSLTLAVGSLRSATSLFELYAATQHGGAKEITLNLVQAAVAVTACAGTVFKHPLGLLITSGNDLIVETGYLIEHLQKGDYPKALESSINIVNQTLYLAFVFKGGIELSIASLAIQICLGIYHVQAEFKQGHYIEGSGHIAMVLLRSYQISGEMKTLRARWAFEEWCEKMFHGELITAKLDPAKFAPPEDGCRIFLIRHAETEWNAAGQSQGWNDIPLNEEGIKQAELLGEYFSDLSIGQVYSSVLSRAVATAGAVAKHHAEAQVTYDPDLRFYDPNRKVLIENETVEQMEARATREIIKEATAYLRDICSKTKGQNIVIITHGKVIKSILSALSGGVMDISQMKIGNTAMVRVISNDSGLSLEM